MKQTFLVIAFVSLAFAGCGGSQNTNSETANANVATESPFAGITDANAALAEGNRLLDENDTQMAIEAYKQAVLLNPDLAEAHFKLGISYALLEMQMEQSGAVTETSSNSKEGRKKTNSERSFEKAVEAYKKWIAANPNDDAAHYYLGRTYAKLTKDDEAEKAFEQAVKLKPDDTEYQTELGAILIKLAKYREAISPLKKAIELDATNGRAADLLEDAEAGRSRVDYVSPKNTNTNSANANANANANSGPSSNSNSNSNSAPKPPPANTKPKKEVPVDGRPRVVANKPG